MYALKPFALALCAAVVLAGCATDGVPNGSLALSARAAAPVRVAFESIDGAPPAVFEKLVQNLAVEADLRRVAVGSREQPANYRMRGYLSAYAARGETAIAWVWDVYDSNGRRVLRVSDEERVAGVPADAWSAADDAVLRRVARASIDRLAAFLEGGATVTRVAEAGS